MSNPLLESRSQAHADRQRRLSLSRARVARQGLAPGLISGRRALTRNRLLDACAALVVELGFESVSMTAIAERAQITRQTAYRYFPNAREALQAMLQREAQQILEGQLTIFGDGGEPGTLLVESVLSTLRRIEQNDVLRAAWSSRHYPQAPHAILRSTLDPAFAERAIGGLHSIGEHLGWSERDRREAYDVIVRAVVSLLTLPPASSATEADLRDLLRRRLLPALGV